MTGRKPLPDFAHTAINEAGSHQMEAIKLLESLGPCIPQERRAEYFEILYHQAMVQSWCLAAGAKIIPQEM